jgi:hypothetical protein
MKSILHKNLSFLVIVGMGGGFHFFAFLLMGLCVFDVDNGLLYGCRRGMGH